MSDDLPEGWALTRLDDVCEVNPRKPSSDALPEHAAVTFVPMAAVDDVSGTITRPETRTFGEVRNGYTAFGEGDVILAKITPCFENGKAAIVSRLENHIGFGSSEFHVLRPRRGVLAEYIYHFLRQPRFRDEAAGHMSGTAGQERVPVDYLRQCPIPIPPTAEQRRIVEDLAAVMAQVSAARGRLERVLRLLRQSRRAVLVAACDGRLTEGWRTTHGEDKGNGDLGKAWTRTTLGELSSHITSGSRGWAKYYAESGPLFIRAQDINTDELELEGVARVRPPSGSEGARTRVNQHDLLITITGANVTKTALVRDPLPEAYVSQHVALVRLHDPALSPWVHLLLLSTEHGRKQLLELAYGAGKPGLNLENVRAVLIDLPPRLEREVIIHRVKALFSLANTAERRVSGALAQAGSLPQAILSRAFTGELVPCEAELARMEGRSYETADQLLARVRSERETQHGRPERRVRTARRASVEQSRST